MKATFFIRLAGCFIFSALYAVFISVMNSSGMRILVAPVLLAVFPSIIMGALFYSLVGGERYLVRHLGLSLRILSLILVAIGFLLFGMNPDMFHHSNVEDVLGSAILGLALGYLMSDWHVQLYRAIFSKKVVGMAAGVFILSYYCVYSFFFPYGKAIVTYIENQNLLLGFCSLCLFILFALMLIDQIFLKQGTESKNFLVKDFSFIRSRLILIGLLALQTFFFGMVIWGWFVYKSFTNGWVFVGNDTSFLQLILLPSVIVFTLMSVVFLTYIQNSYAVYSVQVLAFVTGIMIIIGLVLGWHQYPVMNVLFVFTIAANVGSMILTSYYMIMGFRSGLIGIFVPVGVCIILFFSAIRQIVTPAFPALSHQMVENTVLVSAFAIAAIACITIYYALFGMKMIPPGFQFKREWKHSISLEKLSFGLIKKK